MQTTGPEKVFVRSDIPVESQLFPKKYNSYYVDSYEILLEQDNRSAYEIYCHIVEQTPAWVNFLMRIRDFFVPLIGVRRVGLLGSGVNEKNERHDVSVGRKVDIFTIWSVSDAEIIVGEDDSHLDFRLSLLKLHEYGTSKLVLSMVVHVNNSIGRMYMAVVIPFHKIIMKKLLGKIGKKSLI